MPQTLTLAPDALTVADHTQPATKEDLGLLLSMGLITPRTALMYRRAVIDRLGFDSEIIKLLDIQTPAQVVSIRREVEDELKAFRSGKSDA